MLQECHPPSWKMFPIRLDNQMNEKLDAISNQTMIPKSKLVRTAINQFFTKIDDSRVAPYLEDMFTA